MVIRAAHRLDTDAIRNLTLQGAPGVSPFAPDELEWAFAHAAGIWVAESDAKIVGYVLTFASDARYDGEEFQWFRQNGASFLYVDRIAIAPDARGQGLGKRLYAVVTEFAEKRGYESLVCEINLEPPNPGSLSFHRAMGLHTVGTLDTRDGRKVALLRKHLYAND